MGGLIAPLERVATVEEGEIFWQRKVRFHCEFQRHNGDHLKEGRDWKCEGRNKKYDFLARESVT